MSAKRLSDRRRQGRRRAMIALAIVLALATGGALWALRETSLRITNVTVYGADDSFAQYAADAMAGSYLGVIPRNSIIFYPERTIRRHILAAHPEIAALSIFNDGLTGISIKISERVAIARWCGPMPTAGVPEYCYLFDANGYLFAAADVSSTTPINSFKLYASLTGDTQEPLHATISQHELLPKTFDIARQIGTFGSSVESIVIKDGEVNDYLASGTRVTYVLGDEVNAYAALASAKADVDLASGALEYVDLRFSGKVYTKKK